MSGQNFQYNGKLRICNSCLHIEYDHDSSDEDSAHDESFEDEDNNDGNLTVNNNSNYDLINESAANRSIFNEDVHKSDRPASVFDESDILSLSSEEDESSMTLYTALHSDSMANLSDLSRMGEPNLRLSRSSYSIGQLSSNKPLDRAQASLNRMRSRRKSRSVKRTVFEDNASPSSFQVLSFRKLDEQDNLLPNSTQNPMVIDTLEHSVFEKEFMYKELNEINLYHINRFLKQSLLQFNVNLKKSWYRVVSLLLRSIELIDPDPKNGDSFDVTRYVKIKKILGSRPSSSECVNGLIFTKNVALKTMRSKIQNPNVAIIMFPLEYAKGSQNFMSIDQVIAQEKEFLHKLVKRIILLLPKPDVLVSGSSISGYALRLLAEANISVAYNVKPQVIERLSRLVEADIVATMEKLATNPKLGRCELFEVRSFAFHNTKKTFMFFTGCKSVLGCTLILRGNDEETLNKIKNIVEFMVYMMFHLKLETYYFRNAFISVPKKKDLQEDLKLGVIEGYYMDFIKKFNAKIFTISPTVKIPLPYLLTKARHYDSLYNDFQSKYSISNVNIDVSKQLVKEFGVQLDLSKVEETDIIKIVSFIINKKSKLLKNNFKTFSRQWEAFYGHIPALLEVSFHQSIFFLYSTTNVKNQSYCLFPKILQIEYYLDYTDITFGQYIEQLIYTSNHGCHEGCGSKLIDHYRSYVHGDGRLIVSIEQLPCRIPGLQHVILLWSTCKVCGHTTPVIPMSDATWKMSFGKFLELCFLSIPLDVLFEECEHSFKDRIKYFGLHDLAVKVDYNQIDLLELIVPGDKVHWRPEVDVNIKQDVYNNVVTKTNNLFKGILNRLEGVKIDSTNQEKVDSGKEKIGELIELAKATHEEILLKAKDIYDETLPMEYLPLNVIIKELQNISVSWDNEFNQFEENFLPTENEISSITALQLMNFFKDKKHDDNSIDGGKEEEAKRNADHEKPNCGQRNGFETSNDDASSGDENIDEKKVDQFPSKNADKLVCEEDTPEDSDENNGLVKVDGGEQQLYGEALGDVLSSSPHLNNFKQVNASTSQNRDNSNNNMISRLANRTADEIKRTEAAPNISSKPTGYRYSKVLEEVSKMEAKYSSNAEALKKSLSSYPPTRIPMLNTSNLLENELRSRANLSSENPSGRIVSKKPFNSKVSQLKDYYDQYAKEVNEEFVLHREKERRKIANRYRANPLMTAQPIVEIYQDVEDAVQDEGDERVAEKLKLGSANEDAINSIHRQSSPGNSKAADSPQDYATSITYNDGNTMKLGVSEQAQYEAGAPDDQDSSNVDKDGSNFDQKNTVDEDKKLNANGIENKKQPDSSDRNSTEKDKKEVEIPQQENSLLQTLKKFWADRSVLWKPLDYPLKETEHVSVDSDVIIREDEPSSLIAFALSSKDHQQKIKEKRKELIDSLGTEGTENPENQASGSKTHDMVLELAMLRKTAIHLKFKIIDEPAVLSCKVFFVEQFEALRESCGSNFIQSLSRCIKWDSLGGKSGSAFLKTLDNRLVIKQLSDSELNSFVRMAPSYFEFMAQALFHDLPSVISKIFGFYQIVIKNPNSGKNIKMNVIIMENLFYNRKNLRIFDLKGSMRNRHVEQTGKENEVLLDENMVDYIYESPLFVRLHSKKLLRASLWNDTLFLSKMNVMDYSLVIGIDTEKNELVAGIIDYIRTFTWDKKLESWVKEKGLVGGGGKRPTVVTPKQYKSRFRAAMERYILLVPDKFYISES